MKGQKMFLDFDFITVEGDQHSDVLQMRLSKALLDYQIERGALEPNQVQVVLGLGMHLLGR